MPKKTIVSFVLALGLFACSTPGEDAGPSFAPPAGCARTYCDHEYDECKELYRPKRDQCSECWSICTPDNAVSCSQTCTSICQSESSAPSSDPCDRYRTQCRESVDNRVCIDGVAATNLPETIVGDSEWHAPSKREARCTSAEIEKTLREIQKGTWVFDETAPHGSCARCIATKYDVSDPWGALVMVPVGETLYSGWLNRGGCIALVSGDTSNGSVGAAISSFDECLTKACHAADDTMACRDLSSRTVCKEYVAAATRAEEAIAGDPAYDVCGTATGEFMTDAPKAFDFFCGGKK